jgi:hypothetical protein
MSGWIYHVDEHGNRIRPAPRDLIGYTITPVNPTKRHALSRGGSDPIADIPVEVAWDAARLDPEERAVLELQKRKVRRTTEARVAVVELAEHLDAGWMLVRLEGDGTATIAKEFLAEVLTHEQIAQALSQRWRRPFTVRQVRSRIESANRKMRRMELALE